MKPRISWTSRLPVLGLVGCLAAVAISSPRSEAADGPLLRVRPSLPTGIDVSWRPGTAEGDRSAVFELQSSDDLEHWEPAGNPVLGTSSDILHLRSFAGDRAQRFYRLQTTPRRAVRTMGQGGAEVLGYSRRLEAALSEIGLLSPEAFAARHPVPGPHLDQIPFDPTAARYWQSFNAAPNEVGGGQPPPEDARQYVFRLSAEELAVFRRNGFVVSERLSTRSFAEAFYRLWMDDLPVYVSTDAILQAWHRTYDSLLEELEEVMLCEYLLATLDPELSRACSVGGMVHREGH